MAGRLSFDTSFLIDVHRELGSGEGPAGEFLRRHADSLMFLSAVAFGEFAEGFDDPRHQALQRLASAAKILQIDRETALLYAENARKLRQSGRLIGANDLWIAASALRHDMPLVTRNVRHFRRIPGLAVIGY